MAVTQDKSAPYAPAKTVLEIIERYRNRGLPTPIVSDVLGRAGVSDSLIPRTLQALQTLDLIDETGMPTETLEGIRLASEDEYKDRLREWLNEAYEDVIRFVDPATDDETKIRDAFRTYKPIGQQPRMVTLFLGLYAAAGVAPERNPKKPRQSGSTRPRERPTTKGQDKKAFSWASKTQRHSGTADVPAPIMGLLSSLPSESDGWTQAERERFLTTFQAVLDYCIPLIEEGDSKEAAAEDDPTAA